MNPGGLSDLQLRTVRDIFALYVGRYRRAAIFGSRAVGSARLGSDLDLALYGADQTLRGELLTAFMDSDLSIGVDLVDYDRLSSDTLRNTIDRDNISLEL